MPFTPPSNSTPYTLDDPYSRKSELATGSQPTRGQAHDRTKDGIQHGAQDQATTERRDLRQQLLTGLRYEKSVLEYDMAAKLRIIWQGEIQDQYRVMAIVKSLWLEKWIATTESLALFVNGDHDGSSMMQPTSFICAKLVKSIASPPSNAKPETRTSFPLAFFCGEHLKKDDPSSGPGGMMRNLLAQLLLAYRDFDLRTIQEMQNLNYDDVEDLCHAFDLLITQLPHHFVVYCVIDAVSSFESNTALGEEGSEVIINLVGVAERTRKSGCAFKLLLMSQWNSRALRKAMHDEIRGAAWMSPSKPRQDDYSENMWVHTVDSKLGRVRYDTRELNN